ncbi:MAG: hypothetical protein D6815_01465, partial [Candidatus Dadabacteria bacterium]
VEDVSEALPKIKLRYLDTPGPSMVFCMQVTGKVAACALKMFELIYHDRFADEDICDGLDVWWRQLQPAPAIPKPQKR